MTRTYYASNANLTDSGPEFVAIKHGETGYYPATVSDQEHADLLNKSQGITAPQVEAAILCSMFDCWQNFDKITAEHQEPDQEDKQ